MAQKKRVKKVSQGKHGATKHPLPYVGAILMNKGAYAALVPREVRTPWLGSLSLPKHGPAFPEQAKLNETLYPHLFSKRAAHV